MLTPKFEPIKGRPGWYRAKVGDDPDAAMELAEHLTSTRPPHTYFVFGGLPEDKQWREVAPESLASAPPPLPEILHCTLYRIETSDPLDIVREFKVGSHAEASYGEDALPTVLKELALIHARNPIAPFSADNAGFSCAFERPVTKEFAEFVEATITEGYEAYEDEDYSIAPSVMRENCLHLWWG